MTNAEFQKKLEDIYAKHPLINKSKVKTVNELLYVLRMEDEDYNISIIENDLINIPSWCCIPSVKNTFVSVHMLAKNVVSVKYEEDFADEDIVCLTVEVA